MPPENVHTTIETDISLLLSYVYEYGTFYSQVIYWQETRDVLENGITKTVSYEGVLFDQGYVNKLLHYLIGNGFATRRFDVEIKGKDFIVNLTDRGRRLKELGSLDALMKAEAADRRKENLQDQRALNAHYIQLLLMIWTGIAAVYYILMILVEGPKHRIWYKYHLYPIVICSIIALVATSVLLGIWSIIKRQQRRNK